MPQSALLPWKVSSEDANSADRYQINAFMMQPEFVPPSNEDEVRPEDSDCDNEAKFCHTVFFVSRGASFSL